jgi:predicted nucleotidyltransferase component of viral defense system
MITKQEILNEAGNLKLAPHIVEKDYVLGWILWGISQNKDLLDDWVFKGGTCLKKCYFDSYRMSEDLDFTLRKPEHLNAEFLTQTFAQISKLVYRASGIIIPEDRLDFEFYENPRGVICCLGKLYYSGPIAPTSPKQTPRIKLDLSADEIVVEPPTIKQVEHRYSDLPSEKINIPSYSYVEIFAEKIRALSDRTRPRDLYDVIHFLRRPESAQLAEEVKRVLKVKCNFKDLPFPSYNSIGPSKNFCVSGWKDQLSHQLPVLPSFESFWEDLSLFFEWLEHPEKRVIKLPDISMYKKETIVSDVYNKNLDPSKVNLLTSLQFASSNRLCAEVTYVGINRKKEIYTIEPYSLRESNEEGLVLYSINHLNKELVKLSVTNLLKAKVIETNFAPSFQIDFLPNCQFREITLNT